MRILTFIGALLLLAVAIPAAPTSASAQALRTWVSGVGDDANPCSRTAPCKTFAGAISKTAAAGQISVLDPGGFGAVTITKAITIDGTGSQAGVLASGTNGIIVNAGVNDVVVLRGLDIEGALTGLNGIRFIAGASLHVQNSFISGFRGAAPNGMGIEFAPANTASLFVDNTIVSNNGSTASAAGTGIRIRPTGSASARVVIDHSQVNDNITGLRVVTSDTTGTVNVAVHDTSLSGNRDVGLLVVAASSAANVMIDNVTIEGNASVAGIRADGTAGTVRMSNSNVTGNSTGMQTVNSGKIQSYGNNHVDGNGTDGAPTSTIPQK
ncbi:hypothetical protein DFR52_101148 [Hoeflea marina]|uniref:Parallel beta helix pectate lyase-like protein n=1 Tax=Hoeflea marina TaxID=274592 RepID=A0A317PR98_9HYPH|nr:hypothetical protein [Hoeflea marina]PWW03467.1 hypothetical protein DFR52_101148 [Hoeflea marina]